MKTVIRAALFCSLLVGMGAVFGILATVFAQSYASQRVRESKSNRKANIIYDDGSAS